MQRAIRACFALLGLALTGAASPAVADDDKFDKADAVLDGMPKYDRYGREQHRLRVQLGPRPYWLVDDMDESHLKRRLESCTNIRPRRSDFSIGHRGAPLQFPEHTKESYVAAARMGAGILECDVSFTKDAELVCRHSQCDLHTTTNILATPLAGKCSVPFTPAEFDGDGNLVTPAGAKCCTSDLTVDEFKSLSGKMDAFDPRATTPAGFLGGTAPWRTDLYASRGTLMTHPESIELFRSLRAKFTPELKGTDADIGFGDSGLDQQSYAQALIDDYHDAGIPPHRVWAQSFNLDDVLYWIQNEPAFGRQAVFLDGRYADPAFDPAVPEALSPTMNELAAVGVRILAPPLWVLLQNDGGKLRPSVYARQARNAGLDLITWTIERSGPLSGGGGFYYQTVPELIDNDGDMLDVLHVLAQRVGVIGVFSDWPATTTFYANCFGLD